MSQLGPAQELVGGGSSNLRLWVHLKVSDLSCATGRRPLATSYLLGLSRKYGNISITDYLGIIFLYSLLRASKASSRRPWMNPS